MFTPSIAEKHLRTKGSSSQRSSSPCTVVFQGVLAKIPVIPGKPYLQVKVQKSGTLW